MLRHYVDCCYSECFSQAQAHHADRHYTQYSYAECCLMLFHYTGVMQSVSVLSVIN